MMGSGSRTSRSSGGRLLSGKALFTVTAWGASFVATRIALESFTPTGLVAVRLVVAAAVLAALARITGRPLLPPPAERSICLFLGLVLAAHQLVQAIGLEFTSAINAGWIIGFAPVPIALGARFVLGQRLKAWGWIGVGIAGGGILLIIVSTTPGFAQARTGDLLQLISTLTWALYTLAGAAAVARLGALRVTVPATLAAAALLASAAPWTGVLQAPLSARSVGATLFLGLICSGVGYYLWYRALHEQGAARVGSYLYLEPFVTVAVASALLGERVTLPVIGGGLLVLAGVWAVAHGSRRPEALAEEVAGGSEKDPE